jgi:hypothetical protein
MTTIPYLERVSTTTESPAFVKARTHLHTIIIIILTIIIIIPYREGSHAPTNIIRFERLRTGPLRTGVRREHSQA